MNGGSLADILQKVKSILHSYYLFATSKIDVTLLYCDNQDMYKPVALLLLRTSDV